MKPSRVNLHLTSFGPFLDVVDNPSQRIGEQLEALLRHGDATSSDVPCLTLVHHETLEVSIEAVGAYFAADPLQAHRGVDAAVNGRDHRLGAPQKDIEMFVHLGVHRGARGEVRVELRAANDLHCPQGDFRGNKVSHQPIVCGAPTSELLRLGNVVPSSSSASIEAFETNVPQRALEAAVAVAKSGDEDGRFPASLIYSTDAGRYLCNFCYCNSLNYTSSRNATAAGDALPGAACMSLFVHVLDPAHSCEAPDGTDGATSAAQLKNPSIAQQASCVAQFLTALAAELVRHV